MNLDGVAKKSFGLVANGNGAEAWRKLTQPIRSQSELRRQQLRDKIQHPEPAANTQGVSAAIEKWEANHLEFLECGGSALSNEELKTAFLKLLPHALREQFYLHWEDKFAGDQAQVKDIIAHVR